MRKKILFTIIFLLIFCAFGSAQTYWVYTVQGDVTAKIDGKASPVAGSSPISSKVIITIPAGSRLTVLDESTSKMYTLRTKGVGTIPALLRDNGNTVKEVSSSYLAFVKQKATEKSGDINYMQSAGTSYRGLEQDGIVLPDTVSPGHYMDRLIEACLLARQSASTLDLDGLIKAADDLSILDISRYEFVSDATPRSFNGHLLYDPLCLLDLSATLDAGKPFRDQISNMPVPFAAKVEDEGNSYGNILFSYFIIPAGKSISIDMQCIGHCEAAAIGEMSAPLTMTISSPQAGFYSKYDSEDGVCKAVFDFEEADDTKVTITNKSDKASAVLFAINS